MEKLAVNRKEILCRGENLGTVLSKGFVYAQYYIKMLRACS